MAYEALSKVKDKTTAFVIVTYMLCLTFLAAFGAWTGNQTMWIVSLVALGVPTNSVFNKLFGMGQQVIQFPVVQSELGAKQQ